MELEGARNIANSLRGNPMVDNSSCHTIILDNRITELEAQFDIAQQCAKDNAIALGQQQEIVEKGAKILYARITELEAQRDWLPKIVCLCGSTRFMKVFRQANLTETLAGKIVLSIGCNTKSDDALGLSTKDIERLKELHLRKIDLADEVYVLNVGGYIGSSTRKEIEYAESLNMPVKYLKEIKQPVVDG